MKTLPLILLFSLATCVATSHAQAVKGFGLKAGTVIASQKWSSPHAPDYPTDSRRGIDIGAFIEWFDSPILSILTEVHYIQKGVTFVPGSADDGPVTYSVSPQLDYLSIPLLAKIRFDVQSISIYALLGACVDFLLSSSGHEGFEYIFDKLNKSEYGGTVGAGITFSFVRSLNFGAEFRYSPSFDNVLTSDNRAIRNTSMELLFIAGLLM